MVIFVLLKPMTKWDITRKYNMTEKYIVCDFARSDWGKSETLLKVVDKLKTKTKPTIEELIDGHDKYAVFEINNKTIAVITQGDPNSYQAIGLKRAVAENADIIVCASRTRGDTVDVVYEIAKNGYEVIWLSNFYADDEKLSCIPYLSDISANSIVELIQKF